MADHAAIAAAIAARFAPGTMTAPSGYEAVVESSHIPVQDMASLSLPRVYVGFPQVSYAYGPSVRTGEIVFPVRFYLAQAGDISAHATALYAWLPVLVERLIGQVQLGQSAAGVAWARITGAEIARIPDYAGTAFVGIELAVAVALAEGINPVA